MEITYEMLAKKANEFGLYVCEFFTNDVGDGVCYWNKSGKIEDVAAIEARFKWEKQNRGALAPGEIKTISINYQLLGIPQNDDLPLGGFFQAEAPKKEVFVFVGMFQGINDEVRVFKNEKDAEAAWTAYTEIEYSEFEEDESILDQTKHECSTIYVTEIN